MKLKLKELEIPDDNPFANDKLDRHSEIENLTPIVLNVDAPLVMTINAAWGTGKTTFVRLWRAYLEQNNYQSLYFNAWETDYTDLVDRIKDFPGFEEGEEIMDVMDFLQSQLFQQIELLHRINIEV